MGDPMGDPTGDPMRARRGDRRRASYALLLRAAALLRRPGEEKEEEEEEERRCLGGVRDIFILFRVSSIKSTQKQLKFSETCSTPVYTYRFCHAGSETANGEIEIQST